jgi:hypothetical protein
VSLYRLDRSDGLSSPTFIVAFDGWVDAGSAATTALEQLAGAGIRGGTVCGASDAHAAYIKDRPVRIGLHRDPAE